MQKLTERQIRKARRRNKPKGDYGDTARNFKMPGRNDKCICGSGKKYKYCCLNKAGEHTSYTGNELKRMEAVMKQQELVMKEEQENGKS